MDNIVLLMIILRIMPEIRGLFENYDFFEGQGARALSDLMLLSFVLEPASHCCGHKGETVGYYS